MLSKLQTKREEGFTIIEVLIVLAIAGLILLIVFLAVPALQRNGRNTTRRNDVSALLGAASEYSNNNNGKLPNSCSGTGTVTMEDSLIATEITAQTNVGYYNRSACSAAVPTAAGGLQVAPAFAAVAANSLDTAPEDYVRIIPGATCNSNGDNSVVAGSARSYAAVFLIERGNDQYAQQCQAS